MHLPVQIKHELGSQAKGSCFKTTNVTRRSWLSFSTCSRNTSFYTLCHWFQLVPQRYWCLIVSHVSMDTWDWWCFQQVFMWSSMSPNLRGVAWGASASSARDVEFLATNPLRMRRFIQWSCRPTWWPGETDTPWSETRCSNTTAVRCSVVKRIFVFCVAERRRDFSSHFLFQVIWTSQLCPTTSWKGSKFIRLLKDALRSTTQLLDCGDKPLHWFYWFHWCCSGLCVGARIADFTQKHTRTEGGF